MSHNLRQRLRIAVDMDEVIVDTLGRQVELYNQRFSQGVRVADLRGDLENVVPGEHADAVRGMFLEPGFFISLEPMAGSLAIVAALCERYELFIASAAMDFPSSFAEKFAWLDRHLPFVPPSRRIFCGDKSVLDVDFLIDDSPRHFTRFRGTGVLFSAPHNHASQHPLRVHGWSDVRRLFLESDPTLLLQKQGRAQRQACSLVLFMH